MPKITPVDKPERRTVQAKTKDKPQQEVFKWWNAGSKNELRDQLIATFSVLKEQQQYRDREAAILTRLYQNMPMFNFVGSSLNKINVGNSLPMDRPTMNVVQSCIDTLVSKITQSRPRPVFLTDNGDYKERNLAKKLNHFMQGELYQTKAYELGELILRDASVLGTGCLKVIRTDDDRVGVERILPTELLVDPNDAMYGQPRQLYQFRLVDREVLQEMFPDSNADIGKAEQAYPTAQADDKTISDQVMVVEAWHLRSGKKAKDGRHAIVCSSGVLLDEDFIKDKFPFVFLHYTPRILGFWGQALSDQLKGTQFEINKLLKTISDSINLVGVPRVFVEDGSKVVKAHLNNAIGSIVTYRGTKPSYEVAPCVAPDLYQQLDRLVQYAYQQSGVSALSAAAQKPAGLNSGEAIRNYDDLQTDRFAALSKRYDNVFIDLAYLITDAAKDIAEEEGTYETVYPGKNGTKMVDLPKADLIKDPFVIQCFDTSSLPRDPAGRMAKVTEMIQAGMISIKEGRRLLDYPDLEQNEQLANASEERIFQILDQIVEDAEYTPPDPFMDLQLATQLVTQYYNLYVGARLEEDRCQMLRDFFTQVQALVQAGTPPPQAPMLAPQAAPMPLPQSPLVPNAAPQAG